jgi:hypothetical protein
MYFAFDLLILNVIDAEVGHKNRAVLTEAKSVEFEDVARVYHLFPSLQV